jgi:hypothetical protein
VDRTRVGHALSWVAIGAAAGVLVVACLLAAFEIRIEAFSGAGADQRGFTYTRELVIVRDLVPFGLLPLGAGLFLMACAAVGLVSGSRAGLVIAAFAVSVGLGVLVLDTDDRLGWPGPHGVIGYDSDSDGPLLGPGLDELHTEARRSPEAREPGWTLLGDEHGYAARGLAGWRLFLWSTVALLWLTGYRLARLTLRPLPSALLVAAASLGVLVWLVLRALTNMQ